MCVFKLDIFKEQDVDYEVNFLENFMFSLTCLNHFTLNNVCMLFAFKLCHIHLDFPGGSLGKESANAGVVDSIPGLGRYPGGGNGNPLQYSCL